MKSIKSRLSRSRLQVGGGAIVLALVGFVSYAVASGATLSDPSTYVAAVTGSFNGNPLVTIQKNRTPSTVTPSQISTYFNISAKRTTHGAYISGMPIDIVVKGVARGEFIVDDVTAVFDYCMKSGTYGYGYLGGSCGQVPLGFYAYSTRSANKDFVVSGYLYPTKPMVVYPEQSKGQVALYISGRYPYSGTSVATLRVDLGAWAQADQCAKQKTPPGFKNCTSPYVEVIRGFSSVLKFPRQ